MCVTDEAVDNDGVQICGRHVHDCSLLFSSYCWCPHEAGSDGHGDVLGGHFVDFRVSGQFV